jgi:uncharacterized protein YqgV (UPF0045/DUF77 family)
MPAELSVAPMKHMAAHSDRVVTSVKIDDKKGMQDTIGGKVESVEDRLLIG